MLPAKFRWQPCLLTDWDEMSNLHRGHSVDDAYQVLVVAMFVNRSGRNEQSSQRAFHRCFLPSFGSFGQAVSKEKIFKNRPIRNKNCLWQPYLVMDHNKMCTLQRKPSIAASYQVSVHDRRRTPSDGKSSYCLWQGELKKDIYQDLLLSKESKNIQHVPNNILLILFPIYEFVHYSYIPGILLK